MRRNLLLTAALFLAGAGLSAQQPANNTPPPYRGTFTHVDGAFVTPIPGVPFTATVLIRSEVPTPEGTTLVKQTINEIGRDSKGRIHNERRLLVPETFHGTPMLQEVHLFDPQTRMNTFYEPRTRIARQSILPEPPRPPTFINPNLKVEDLGTTTLANMQARGSRQTRTIPARVSGTATNVTVVDEYWYSEDLHMNLLIRHTDPRSGEQTVALSSIRLGDPDPAFMEIPQDYKVVDMTPPPGAPAVAGQVR
jgi:hypothetical protein